MIVSFGCKEDSTAAVDATIFNVACPLRAGYAGLAGNVVGDSYLPRRRDMAKRTYEEWKAAVDAHVLRMCGMSADDLPDWHYRDAYEEGMSPGRAAARAVQHAREG